MLRTAKTFAVVFVGYGHHGTIVFGDRRQLHQWLSAGSYEIVSLHRHLADAQEKAHDVARERTQIARRVGVKSTIKSLHIDEINTVIRAWAQRAAL